MIGKHFRESKKGGNKRRLIGAGLGAAVGAGHGLYRGDSAKKVGLKALGGAGVGLGAGQAYHAGKRGLAIGKDVKAGIGKIKKEKENAKKRVEDLHNTVTGLRGHIDTLNNTLSSAQQRIGELNETGKSLRGQFSGEKVKEKTRQAAKNVGSKVIGRFL